MTKLLMAAVFLVALGGISTDGAFAKGSNLGLPADSSADIARSSYNKRKKGKDASSTFDEKRSKRKKK